MRRWWLARFTLEELRGLAEAVFGPPVEDPGRKNGPTAWLSRSL
jgi:hypothetical protein